MEDERADPGLLETLAAPTGEPAQDLALGATLATPPPGPSGEPTGRVVRGAGPARTDQVIGRYKILDRLGAGGMGVVYLAEDPQLARKVALKLLHQPDRALTERLVREARAMAKVSHPNVVGVFDVGVASDELGGATYIAMEVVTGHSLRDWQTHRHPVTEVLETYGAAGRGLAAAHAAGIVHRDFKPDNVLVGDDGRVRVTDFGLAASGPHGDGGGATPADRDSVGTLTEAGSLMGTPGYMAPEQFELGNVDPRTDQFSFCASLYEALYGERPFEGRTYGELKGSVCAGKLRPAPARTPVSRALRQIVVRGLAVRPGDRYPTMDHLLAELGRDRARPWRRTAIAAVALGAVLGLGLVTDWVIRDRAVTANRVAFAATGKQFDRAVHLLDSSVDALSNRALVEPALRVVAGTYDDADFGLGTETDDTEKRDKLHDLLVSAELVSYGKVSTGVLAIADKKGRLLYTAASPGAQGGDLLALPSVRRALDGAAADSMTIVNADNPVLARAQLLGLSPVPGPWVLFTRALVLGGSVGALYLQLVDGKTVLDLVSLDDGTMIALVAPDGATVGDVAPVLIAAAHGNRAIVEVDRGGDIYQVQERPLRDLDGKTEIAQFVMARPLSNVISLFPGARPVFAIAAFAMALLALGAAARARQISGARV